MAKPLCIYHGNCADGFTAAWAVWKRFGDTFDYHPGVYQDAPPDVAGRDVVIVDFSYKRAVLLEMANSARSVFVLDHHKTAAEDLAGFLGPVGYNPDALAQQFDEQRMPPISVLFDMNRSGAGIAWDFFHPGKPRPRLIDYVEDRDLWRFNLPGSRAFSANLFSLAYDFHIWDRVARASDDDRKLQAFIDEGEAIERKHHKDVAERKHHKDVAELVKARGATLIAVSAMLAAIFTGWMVIEFSRRTTDKFVDVNGKLDSFANDLNKLWNLRGR